eukprot:285303_1
MNKNNPFSEETTNKIKLFSPPNWGKMATTTQNDQIFIECVCSDYPSLIGNFKLISSKWYYEVTVHNPGTGRFGYGTHTQNMVDHYSFGKGTGDDENGWAFNGKERKVYHNA